MSSLQQLAKGLRVPVLDNGNWRIWKLRWTVAMRGASLHEAFDVPLFVDEVFPNDGDEGDEQDLQFVSVLDGKHVSYCLEMPVEELQRWVLSLGDEEMLKREKAYALLVSSVSDDCIHLIDGKTDPALAYSALWSECEKSSALGKAQLHVEFHSLTLAQHGGDFSRFCSAIARVALSLRALGEAPSEDAKLARLLVGLGEDRKSLRDAVLMMGLSFKSACTKIKASMEFDVSTSVSSRPVAFAQEARTDGPRARSNKPCFDFAKGLCRRKVCRFSHDAKVRARRCPLCDGAHLVNACPRLKQVNSVGTGVVDSEEDADYFAWMLRVVPSLFVLNKVFTLCIFNYLLRSNKSLFNWILLLHVQETSPS